MAEERSGRRQLVALRTDAGGTVVFGEGDAHPALAFDPRHAEGRSIFGAFEGCADVVAGIREALEGRPGRASIAAGAASLVLRFEPRRDGEGRVVGCAVLGVQADAGEKELALSEARLAEAQHIAHIGSWEWDAVRNVVAWTDELYRIYALEKESFAGTYEAFLERVLPEDREYTRTVIFEAFSTTW